MKNLENELFSRATVGFYNTAYVNKDDQAIYSVKNVVSLDTLADNLVDVLSRNDRDLANVLNGTDPEQNKVIAELLSTTYVLNKK